MNFPDDIERRENVLARSAGVSQCQCGCNINRCHHGGVGEAGGGVCGVNFIIFFFSCCKLMT